MILKIDSKRREQERKDGKFYCEYCFWNNIKTEITRYQKVACCGTCDKCHKELFEGKECINVTGVSL